jgi:hypothetical protein
MIPDSGGRHPLHHGHPDEFIQPSILTAPPDAIYRLQKIDRSHHFAKLAKSRANFSRRA